MLDPAVSAAIKKYGLIKWACLEYPYIVGSFAFAVFGVGFGTYWAYQDVKKREITKYFFRYTVMRPDDPRLKKVIVWDEEGNPINPKKMESKD